MSDDRILTPEELEKLFGAVQDRQMAELLRQKEELAGILSTLVYQIDDMIVKT